VARSALPVRRATGFRSCSMVDFLPPVGDDNSWESTRRRNSSRERVPNCVGAHAESDCDVGDGHNDAPPQPEAGDVAGVDELVGPSDGSVWWCRLLL
jgi:hypothetical protein